MSPERELMRRETCCVQGVGRVVRMRRVRRAVVVVVLSMALLLLAVSSWLEADMRLHTSPSDEVRELRNRMQQVDSERRGPPQWVPPPFGVPLTNT